MFSIDGSNGRERYNLLQLEDKSESLSSYNLFTIKTKRYKLEDKSESFTSYKLFSKLRQRYELSDNRDRQK